MVRLGGTVDIAAVDTLPFFAVVPALLAGWRALAFVDGVVLHPVTGRPHAGLRVVDGRHPHRGVVYRLVLSNEVVAGPTPQEAALARRLADAQPQALGDWERGRVAAARATGHVEVTWDEFEVRLAADEPSLTSFAVRHAGWSGRLDLPRTGPIEAAVSIPWTDAGWFPRGTVQAVLRIDPLTLPPYEEDPYEEDPYEEDPYEVDPHEEEEPQLTASFTHPLGWATAKIRMAGAGSGRWRMTTHAGVRGRGWLWPVMPFLKRPLQRALDRLLLGLPRRVDELNRELTRHTDPRLGAERLLADLITAVPVRMP